MADVEVGRLEASGDGTAAPAAAGLVPSTETSAGHGAAAREVPQRRRPRDRWGLPSGSGHWRPSSSLTLPVPSPFITAPALPVCRRSWPWS